MGRVKKNSNGYYSPFAERLRELLESFDIPQSMLADYIGVTRQAVSAYSLGTSVPDIEKFEKIADYFEVSTEYLLKRTDIRKADATKQATAEYLGLSEEAIDKITALKVGRVEQNFLQDYKVTIKSEPLLDMFSSWLEAVDLSKITSDIYRLLNVTLSYNQSGKNPEKHMLKDREKEAVLLLQEKEYVVLSLSEQLAFYKQSSVGKFNDSIERMIDEVISISSEETEDEN